VDTFTQKTVGLYSEIQMVIFIVDLNHDLVSSLGDNNQTRQKPPIGDFNLLGYDHRSMIVITSLAHCLA